MRRRRILLLVAAAVAVAAGPAAAAAAADKPEPAPTPGRAADDAYVARQASARVESAATAIRSRIQAYVRANGSAYSWAAFADVTTDRVVVQSDAPATAVTAVVGEYAALTDVRRGGTRDLYSRRDDTPAFWGGAGVKGPSPGACSTGYAVKAGAFRFLVTAGHCWSDGTIVRTEIGGARVGVVLGKSTFMEDVELIGQETYGSSVYVGGVNSSTGERVEGAADPKPGFASHCHSGRTTGENCGHVVTSTNTLICTKSGCKFPVTAFVFGAMPQGGDSGSPFYVYDGDGDGVHIRGHVIAGDDGGVFGYAELFSKVAAKYSVSIVT